MLPLIFEPVTVKWGESIAMARVVTAVCDACDLAFELWSPRGEDVLLKCSYPYRINIRTGKRRRKR